MSDLEAKLAQARQKNLGDIQKTKQFRTDFEKLKSNYSTQVESLRRQLDAENKRREKNQEDAETCGVFT